MSDQNDAPYAAEAAQQFEKVSKDWPTGELSQSAYGGAADIPCDLFIQYMFQPEVDTSKMTEEQMRTTLTFFVQFDLFIGVDPDKVFELKKRSLAEQDSNNFVEWPANFPDSGNKYEFVSHCGANKKKTEVFFTQGKSKWTLIVVGSSTDAESLVQYADGAWQVVYGMGLCE